MGAPDLIRNQVMWNRLIAIVEEQAQVLVRASLSTSTREAGDLSAGGNTGGCTGGANGL